MPRCFLFIPLIVKLYEKVKLPPRSATARVVGALGASSESPAYQLAPQRVTSVTRTLDGVRYADVTHRRRVAKRKASSGKGSKKGHAGQPNVGRKGCADSHMVSGDNGGPVGLDGDGDGTPGCETGDAGKGRVLHYFLEDD